MKTVPPELQAHREWLGQIGPVGLVVSPNVLVKHNVFINRQQSAEKQERLRELLADDGSDRVLDPLALFREILDWPASLLAGEPGGPTLPDALIVPLTEYADRLTPTYAVPDPEKPGEWLALIQVVQADVDLDKPSKKRKPWRYRWPDDIRDEVLGRLLSLNAERAALGASIGAGPPGRMSPGTRASLGTPLLDGDL